MATKNGQLATLVPTYTTALNMSSVPSDIIGTFVQFDPSLFLFNDYYFPNAQPKVFTLGSGCGSVGRAVAFDTRGPRFESSHWQKFIYTLNICLLSTVY